MKHDELLEVSVSQLTAGGALAVFIIAIASFAVRAFL